MTVTTEEGPNFRKILVFLLKIKGFDGLRYKPNYIKRRIAVRMRARASATYQDYLEVLQSDPQEPSHLLDRLTIHVTEFFRDPSVYKALNEKILPAALPLLPEKKLRFWCAGCSTGEEPYSVAILLKEWAMVQKPFSFDILATDIDAASIETAEKGEYALESVKKLPRVQAARWFRPAGSRLLISQELKHFVRFTTHDLMGEWRGDWKGFEMIFCRNLLIYLTGPQQQKLYERFAGILAPGGYLFLGLAETLLGPARRFYQCVDVRNRIYQTLPSPLKKDPMEASLG